MTATSIYLEHEKQLSEQITMIQFFIKTPVEEWNVLCKLSAPLLHSEAKQKQMELCQQIKLSVILVTLVGY